MINNNWKKIGLILKPNKKLFWSKTHCMIPTPYKVNEGIFKIYYSGRDKFNRSHIGYTYLDLTNGVKFLKESSKLVLKPGRLGCFDDNGVTPSCLIKVKSKLLLFYIGWNPGSTVRMHLFGGLATSSDNGESFKRWSEAPIIERSKNDPYLNTAPWIVNNKKEYIMYYVSGSEWKNKDLPRYNIKFATSSDCYLWNRNGDIAIDYKNKFENALARPFVLKEKNKWKMWFSSKGKNYKLNYAESLDGKKWKRMENKIGIKKSSNKKSFDSHMIEYASIIKYQGYEFMLYNGNNYGAEGIGIAERKI